MTIKQYDKIFEKHINILFPNWNIHFYVSKRSKYVHMGLDCALCTLKDHENIICEVRDFMYDELDEPFTFCFPQLVPTVK